MRKWLVGIGAIILASCSQAEPDGGNAGGSYEAERGVAQFRRQMDARQFREIYEASAPEFRENASESTIIRFLNAVSTRLGPVRVAERRGWRFENHANGSFVSLEFATTFEHGRGNERFLFRRDERGVRLAGYHINSMDLMIDQIAPPGNELGGVGNETEPPPNQVVPAPVRR